MRRIAAVVSLQHMHPLPGWHPIIVHFAIASSLTGGVALLLARLMRGERAPRRCAVLGTFSLCIGAAGGLLALVSGIAAVWEADLTALQRAAVALHVKWAFFTVMALLLVAVWRAAGAEPEEPPSNLFLAVAAGVMLAVAITGWLGGENVYRYGIGVMPPAGG